MCHLRINPEAETKPEWLEELLCRGFAIPPNCRFDLSLSNGGNLSAVDQACGRAALRLIDGRACAL
jgi:hypothetical protein